MTYNSYKTTYTLEKTLPLILEDVVYWIMRVIARGYHPFENVCKFSIIATLGASRWLAKTGVKGPTILRVLTMRPDVAIASIYTRARPSDILLGALCQDDNKLGFASMTYMVSNKLGRPPAQALGSILPHYYLAQGHCVSNPVDFARQVDMLVNKLDALPIISDASERIGRWQSKAWSFSAPTDPDKRPWFTKHCPSCGTPRRYKFRWKHGIRNKCDQQESPLTESGARYLNGAAVGPASPGLLRLQSSSLPLDQGLEFEDLDIKLPEFFSTGPNDGWQQAPKDVRWCVDFLVGGAPPRVA